MNVLARLQRPAADPGSRLFSKIRLRLILWYVSVMTAALLLLGIVLYFAMQQTLLGPVRSELRAYAQDMAQRWQVDPTICPGEPGVLWACYDAQGHLLTSSRVAALVPAFANGSLAIPAAHGGSATDVVSGAAALGPYSAYSSAVAWYAQSAELHAPAGQSLGIVVVGAPVGEYLHALNVLLTILVILGILTILLAAFSGLFLADRALLPARIAYRRQQEFIADASHELRTPLTMLRADAEVLLRDKQHMPPDDSSLVEDIVHEAAHMSSLADAMLDLARLDAGETHLEQEVVDLSDLTADIARRARARAEERNLSIGVNAQPDIQVLADRPLLEQAILALVDNAIKYSEPGGAVQLDVSADDGRAEVVVRDTGIGIASEHIPHLGERFFRVDKARSRASGGAGLGLAFVRHIIQLHGGSVSIESELGQGTAITISLPLLTIRRREPVAGSPV